MRCLKRCQSLHGLPVFAEVCKFVEIKITMEKKVSADAMILQNRTAFALYLKKGLGEVERLYPDSLKFVQQHQDKSLKEVTQLLTEMLNAQSERLIPVSAR